MIHKEDQINLYGGSLGIRNRELLESAVNMPVISFEGHYLHKTIFDKASAYIFHIAQNNPFSSMEIENCSGDWFSLFRFKWN